MITITIEQWQYIIGAALFIFASLAIVFIILYVLIKQSSSSTPPNNGWITSCQCSLPCTTNENPPVNTCTTLCANNKTCKDSTKPPDLTGEPCNTKPCKWVADDVWKPQTMPRG